MNNFYQNETIAAISTPPGEGGIAVVRISGKESLGILKNIFYTDNGKPVKFETHRLVHGEIRDARKNKTIDSVMCVYMKSPNSFTGEDTVEIYCHGGYIVPRQVLELVLAYGATPAEAGEFTKRSFLNGKMDLSQAEAVANIIHAQTETGVHYAETQLRGELSKRINELKDDLLDILAEVEAHVDFPEEDIEESIKQQIVFRCNRISDMVNSLIESYNTGKIFKNGIITAILGKPNVGKSSLLNQLLRQERAIVSPVAGTTRDFIEEVIDLDGIPLKITDTAGIRTTTDEIEKIGVGLAEKKAKEAELLIIVIDASSQLDKDDIEVLNCIGNKKSVVILNKSDLENKTDASQISHYTQTPVVRVSALKGDGLDELKRAIHNSVLEGKTTRESSEVILTDLRHKECLEKCNKHIEAFLKLLETDESPEFLAIDIRAALDSLGEITGEVTTEDILGRIFSKFCIGK